MSIEEESYSSSSQRLEGKIAIVSGGASGVGEAAVRLFAAHGATVVIADVDESRGNSRAASLSPQVTFVHCDITSEQDIETLIISTVSKYGSIHVFFNNAGIIGGGESESRSSILDFDAAEFDRIVTVSVRGTALGIKHAARAMIAAGARGGSIICTASAAASKHAIVGLAKNAACELGRFGIRVNCISSFGVWEEDGGGGAEAAARGIGEAAVFLASDESKYISGHNLVVDGGLTTSNNFPVF